MPDRYADLRAWGLSEGVARRVAERERVRPSGPVRDPRSEQERRAALLAEQDRLARQRPLERLLGSLPTDAPPAAPRLPMTLASMGAAPTPTVQSRIGNALTALVDDPANYDVGGVPARGSVEPFFDLGMDALSTTAAGLTRGLRAAGMINPQLDPQEEALRLADIRQGRPMLGGAEARIGADPGMSLSSIARPMVAHAADVLANRAEPDTTGSFLADTALSVASPENWMGAGALKFAAAPIAVIKKAMSKGAALTGAEASVKRAAVASDVLSSLDDVQRNALLTEITNRFPRLDAYAKPASYLSPKMLAAKSSDLSSTAQSFVRAMADNTSAPISPLELHALAQGSVYKPARIVRRGHKPSVGQDANVPREAKFAGAPYDVSSSGHERTRLKSYLDQVELGKEGADWYDTGGTGTLFAMGDDIPRAREFADVEAITSPATSVDVNTGFALEGVEQLESGLPVKTGRFPAAMSAAIEKLRGSGNVTGLKRLPFSQQIQLGGKFSEVGSPRSVHDIWDMEAWGYTNPDGSELRRGATEAEHRWMDAQTERAIAYANKQKLGGRTDWTTGRLQAAAWTGAKIRAGKLAPGAAVEDIASSFAKRQFELSREAIPGRTAQHLEGLSGPELDQYARDQFGIDTDPQGRSRLAMSQRAAVARGGEAPGVFKGDVSPGYQARIVVPIKPDPRGGTQVYPPSMERAARIEASYAFSRAQDAGAGSRLTDWPTQKEYAEWQASTPDKYQWPMRGAEVTLNRTPTSAEVAQIDALMTKAAGGNSGNVAVVSIPGQGVRLGNLPDSPLSLKEFDKAAADAAKIMNAPTPKKGRFDSLYVSNDWIKKTLGQEYWKYLPESGSLGERELQRQVQEVATRDAAVVAANPSISSNAIIQEIRAVYAKGGIAAMRAFATERGLPLATVLLALGIGAQSQPSNGGSPRMSSDGDNGSPRLDSRRQGGA